MPKARVVREKSLNGDIHLIIPESVFDANMERTENLDKVEIRKIMKREASKRLLLLREE